LFFGRLFRFAPRLNPTYGHRLMVNMASADKSLVSSSAEELPDNTPPVRSKGPRPGLSSADGASKIKKDAPARPLRRLNQHQLEVFNAIVTTGSITAAARHLHISQPGVSRSLSNLEHEIGFALFMRDKKRVVITPEGTSFHEEVRRSYLGLDRLAQAAQEIRELRRAHLRIASLPALSFGMVPNAIKVFLDANPGLKITFEAHMSSHVIESVVNQRIDIGIAQVAVEYPGLKVHSSFRSDCVCVMPIGHPYCNKEVIREADLPGQQFVALPPYTMAGRQFDRFAVNGQPMVPRMETLGTSAACAMVAEGIGLAIVDPFSASFACGRVVQRPFLPTINFGFRLVYPDNRVLSTVASSMLHHLADAFERHPLVRERSQPRANAAPPLSEIDRHQRLGS
jgi:DNA-binding transcriptional LysR family regulator